MFFLDRLKDSQFVSKSDKLLKTGYVSYKREFILLVLLAGKEHLLFPCGQFDFLCNLFAFLPANTNNCHFQVIVNFTYLLCETCPLCCVMEEAHSSPFSQWLDKKRVTGHTKSPGSKTKGTNSRNGANGVFLPSDQPLLFGTMTIPLDLTLSTVQPCSPAMVPHCSFPGIELTESLGYFFLTSYPEYVGAEVD